MLNLTGNTTFDRDCLTTFVGLPPDPLRGAAVLAVIATSSAARRKVSSGVGAGFGPGGFGGGCAGCCAAGFGILQELAMQLDVQLAVQLGQAAPSALQEQDS